MDLQRDAIAAVREGFEVVDPLLKKKFKGYGVTIPEAQVALVAIDPHTGAIKALVGGRNYAASQLNRALSRRPPGSVFKPFVYTAALNTALTDPANALTPVSTFVDEPTTFIYSGGRTYQPGNFHDSFSGTVTLRYALTKSLNIPTVKIAERVGYGTVLDLAKRAGLDMDGASATPAIALGSVGETPIDMAGAYTIFANNGQFVQPNYISEIRDQHGTSIYESTLEKKLTIDPRVVYMMTNLMEDVLRTGTGAGVRSRGFTLPAAGKTGSSHDAWFAGYTSKLLCVVWVGFDDYRDVKLEGAKAALPIWTAFMKRAHTHRSYRRVSGFDAPSGIVSADVDPESGQLATSACPTFKSEVFIAGTQRRGVVSSARRRQHAGGELGDRRTVASHCARGNPSNRRRLASRGSRHRALHPDHAAARPPACRGETEEKRVFRSPQKRVQVAPSTLVHGSVQRYSVRKIKGGRICSPRFYALQRS